MSQRGDDRLEEVTAMASRTVRERQRDQKEANRQRAASAREGRRERAQAARDRRRVRGVEPELERLGYQPPRRARW